MKDVLELIQILRQSALVIAKCMIDLPPEKHAEYMQLVRDYDNSITNLKRFAEANNGYNRVCQSAKNKR